MYPLRSCLIATLLVLILAAPARAAITRGWAAAPSMKIARVDHSAVLLDNGKVLVAGGNAGTAGNGVYLASVELYDPATGAWSAATPMPTARQRFAMVKLAGGKVLVAGGSSNLGSALYNAELYDPAADTWTPLPNTHYAHGRASAVLLENGKVLLVGGGGSPEWFDPNTNQWTDAGTTNYPVSSQDAAALPGNRVLLAGASWTTSDQPPTWTYNWGSNGWATNAGSMIQKRSLTRLSPLPGGRVLATGGYAIPQGGDTRVAEIFDPALNVWFQASPMPNLHREHTTTSLPNGQVLLAGGYAGDDATAVADLYDPATDSWSSPGNLLAPRIAHTATLLKDGRVLVTGGLPNPVSVELWTPTTSLITSAGLTFTDQPQGAPVATPLELTNTGDSPLFTDDYAITGLHPQDFAVSTERCKGPVAPGTSCTIDVRFTPTATGPRLATLAFGANTVAGRYIVPLAGNAIVPPAITPVADTDGDGIPDATDRCRALKGPAPRLGCPTGLLNDPSIRYAPGKRGIRVLAYYVKATKGATITVTCSKHACKRTSAGGRGNRRVRIAGLSNRRLPNGTRITVSVASAGALTTTVYDEIARGRRVEGRPRCTQPGTSAPLFGC